MSTTMTRRDESWRQAAACRDSEVDMFFPASEDDAEPAKAICAQCPVRYECLDWAIRTRQDYGVWGGLTESERRQLRRRQVAATRVA